MEFLLKHPESPFTKEELYRHSQGITCKPLSNKSFKTDEEFLRALYENTDTLHVIREGLRIRGFGFDFEAKYTPSPEEIKDNMASAKGESDINGVEGTTE